MVNSTAEIRQQSISLLKNDKATISPPAPAGGSVSAVQDSAPAQRPAVVKGGYTATSELFSQGQQQVTRGQIAYQGLVSVGRDLQGMKKSSLRCWAVRQQLLRAVWISFSDTIAISNKR
ncbi:hypothetical protein [Photobacterium sp. Hal280]|uniref:hypothetical protein n=1 Tax=Photobacterium sp. Hal280 TaxID=3035163 RepID=UPI00301E36E3